MAVAIPLYLDRLVTNWCNFGIQMGLFTFHDRQIIKRSGKRRWSIPRFFYLQLLLLVSRLLNMLQIDNFRVLFASVKKM